MADGTWLSLGVAVCGGFSRTLIAGFEWHTKKRRTDLDRQEGFERVRAGFIDDLAEELRTTRAEVAELRHNTTLKGTVEADLRQELANLGVRNDQLENQIADATREHQQLIADGERLKLAWETSNRELAEQLAALQARQEVHEASCPPRSADSSA